MERLGRPPSPGKCVWPSEAAGSEEVAASHTLLRGTEVGQTGQAEAEVLQKVAEALAGNAHTTGVAIHLVRLQINFAIHEERRFGVPLHRTPHAASDVEFADRHMSILQGRTRFVHEGQGDMEPWQTHRDAIDVPTRPRWASVSPRTGLGAARWWQPANGTAIRSSSENKH